MISDGPETLEAQAKLQDVFGRELGLEEQTDEQEQHIF